MELELTDTEAQRLIKMFKEAFQKYNRQIKENDVGEFLLVGLGGEINGKFRLKYKFTNENKVFHFMECKYNLTLFRINLNNSFHKNANGEKIYGNRINVFSEEEFYEKGDNITHCKAYPLPYETIKNTDDFYEMLLNIIEFTNIIQNDNLNISLQGKMF